MSSQLIAVISAGLSELSSTKLLADRLRDVTVEELTRQGKAVRSVDIPLRPLSQDIASHLVSQNPSQELAEAILTTLQADSIIAVTPTFNGSYSGLFKSFFDLVEEGQLASIPVALAATGGSARHSLMVDVHMRPMFTYLKAQTVPTSVFAASEDWGTGSLDARIRREGTELAALMSAMPRRRQEDPFDETSSSFISFDQMAEVF